MPRASLVSHAYKKNGRPEEELPTSFHNIDRPEDFLAEDRPEGELVGVALERSLAEFGKKAGIQPILSAFGELKDVFPGDLTEIERLPGTGVPSLLKLELGAPKAVDPYSNSWERLSSPLWARSGSWP